MPELGAFGGRRGSGRKKRRGERKEGKRRRRRVREGMDCLSAYPLTSPPPSPKCFISKDDNILDPNHLQNHSGILDLVQ